MKRVSGGWKRGKRRYLSTNFCSDGLRGLIAMPGETRADCGAARRWAGLWRGVFGRAYTHLCVFCHNLPECVVGWFQEVLSVPQDTCWPSDLSRWNCFKFQALSAFPCECSDVSFMVQLMHITLWSRSSLHASHSPVFRCRYTYQSHTHTYTHTNMYI